MTGPVLTYRTVSRLSGPLVFVRGVRQATYGAVVELILDDGTRRRGQIIDASGELSCVQVFETTEGLDVRTTAVQLGEAQVLVEVTRRCLGRAFTGIGLPLDGLPPVVPDRLVPAAGAPLNPYAREEPAECIQTGLSVIDGMNTLVRGQKLPIFSGAGLPAHEVAAQIIEHAQLPGGEPFAVIFAGIGITGREAEFFLETFEQSGARERTALYLNRADDPAVERLLVPRFALALAEHLAFDLEMHVLVVLADMTAYCEALRQVALARREVPGRRGFPGFMYTDLATIYERAGRIKGRGGSLTQVPILTMPDDDITHPIPDLTGYVTEGQIVLSRDLHRREIFPPVDVLPCLSRLMHLGIGPGKTREDHKALSNQLYAAYARGVDARRLRDIVGADALSELDRTYLAFAEEFEERFIGQGRQPRTLVETLDLGWELLRRLPRAELSRIDQRLLQRYLGSAGPAAP
ncbi:MAG: V-type ATP synthase subunit B [Armatimonadota bacterium]|nr:V-type ATP synthase subunit B [Armatimonadota bacterium]MDR7536779.1 V-type ATP synthase subunit B [Armatimonadota bacterium]